MPASTHPDQPSAAAAQPQRQRSMEADLKQQWAEAKGHMAGGGDMPVGHLIGLWGAGIRTAQQFRWWGRPQFWAEFLDDVAAASPLQGHPAAAIEAADTPAQVLDVASHSRDVLHASEAMQHTVAETPRECAPTCLQFQLLAAAGVLHYRPALPLGAAAPHTCCPSHIAS